MTEQARKEFLTRLTHRHWMVRVALKLVGLGPLVFLGLLWLVLSIASPYFFTTLNIENLFEATSIVAILALGQLLVVLTGGIDISQAAVVALCTVIGARLSHALTDNGIVIVLIIVGVGTAFGALNAFLSETMRLASPFIVTLGTLSIATGLSYVLSGGSIITGLPNLVQDLGAGSILGIPEPVFLVVACGVLTAILGSRLKWGRWIYAVGGNREAAERVGIPARRVVISTFVIAGMAAGIAAVVQAGLTNSGQGATDLTNTLNAIAAVVIGGASLQGGRGTVSGTLVGALILETISNGLELLSVNTNWEPIVLGVVLLLALGTDLVRSHLESRLRLREVGQLDERTEEPVTEVPVVERDPVEVA